MSLSAYYEQLDAEIAAIATLEKVRLNETVPFDGIGDLASSMLHKAHALSVVLSNHINDMGEGDEDGSSRNCHLAISLDAISHFVAVAYVANRANERKLELELGK